MEETDRKLTGQSRRGGGGGSLIQLRSPGLSQIPENSDKEGCTQIGNLGASSDQMYPRSMTG